MAAPAPGNRYMGNLVFFMRLMPVHKGAPRSKICAIDCNNADFADSSQFESIIAIGSIPRTRIFAKLNVEVNNKRWKMLYNIHHPTTTRSKAIQWSPVNWKILAIGTDDSECMKIDIVHMEGERFKKGNRIEFATEHQLLSICWDYTGHLLLATLGQVDGSGSGSKMVVIKDPKKADCTKYVVDTGYKGSFFAVFQPGGKFIFSCSEDVGAIWVWTGNESNVWSKFLSIQTNGGLRKMSFSYDGTILAGIGRSLIIWDVSSDLEAAAEPTLKLNLRARTLRDTNPIRPRGVSLEEHCKNLSSVSFCRDGTLVTGSSRGSMCLHEAAPVGGTTDLPTIKRVTPFKVKAFQWCDVQTVFPQGEITCVQGLYSNYLSTMSVVVSGGTDGIVTLWKYVDGSQPVIDRNPNIERYHYEPHYQRLNDSVNMDKDDAESVSSIGSDNNADVDLLLTVKAELGVLYLKQNKLQKKLEETSNCMAAVLDVLENVAKNTQRAKIQHDEISTSLARINQLLSLGL